MDENQKKAIIIGASSGIGRALAKKLSAEGYLVGLAGRSLEKLQALQAELPGESQVKQIDVRDTREAIHSLRNLIMSMHGVDILVVNAGVLFQNEDFVWHHEEEMIKVNALGFAAMANVGVTYFLSKGSGCLVGISSVACHRGSGRSPSYNASKAFISNYMEGLRQKLSATAIKVVDIRPGFVDTAMTQGRKGLFGVISPEHAAVFIFNAIQKGRSIAYVPSWWGIVMWFLKRLPENIYHLGYRKYLAWDKKPSHP
ncbi:MAG TPA: SDR family NAD(P)-dependent oxidoreductase [Candidatus Omnitrophota bacterium]|nr:SDR family NAD(P)-dependent oxidoreductase [Candidatus Omnitrophota bacterium]